MLLLRLVAQLVGVGERVAAEAVRLRLDERGALAAARPLLPPPTQPPAPAHAHFAAVMSAAFVMHGTDRCELL